jgi:hypothetical protein
MRPGWDLDSHPARPRGAMQTAKCETHGFLGACPGHVLAPEAVIRDEQWARQDSNLDLTDYESAALTD